MAKVLAFSELQLPE
uniref:Uncharacterized protein n=1 Tax=Anguilla anguilla TaxID=7936 RepID=A0A0E9QN94_ANGAN